MGSWRWQRRCPQRAWPPQAHTQGPLGQGYRVRGSEIRSKIRSARIASSALANQFAVQKPSRMLAVARFLTLGFAVQRQVPHSNALRAMGARMAVTGPLRGALPEGVTLPEGRSGIIMFDGGTKTAKKAACTLLALRRAFASPCGQCAISATAGSALCLTMIQTASLHSHRCRAQRVGSSLRRAGAMPTISVST